MSVYNMNPPKNNEIHSLRLFEMKKFIAYVGRLIINWTNI